MIYSTTTFGTVCNVVRHFYYFWRLLLLLKSQLLRNQIKGLLNFECSLEWVIFPWLSLGEFLIPREFGGENKSFQKILWDPVRPSWMKKICPKDILSKQYKGHQFNDEFSFSDKNFLMKLRQAALERKIIVL